MPGPIPNRSEDLSRSRDANRSNRPELSKGVAQDAVIPDPDPNWDKVASMLWDSLHTSGQSDYYQSSDWAYAYFVCETLDKYVRTTKRSGQMFAAITSAMNNLLITEGDRRRMRIELEKPVEQEVDASVTAIADYRKDLGL